MATRELPKAMTSAAECMPGCCQSRPVGFSQRVTRLVEAIRATASTIRDRAKHRSFSALCWIQLVHVSPSATVQIIAIPSAWLPYCTGTISPYSSAVR
jgi:hypothetical protein